MKDAHTDLILLIYAYMLIRVSSELEIVLFAKNLSLRFWNSLLICVPHTPTFFSNCFRRRLQPPTQDQLHKRRDLFQK